jgi:tetratricopeptide (TPR) repeat protein
LPEAAIEALTKGQLAATNALLSYDSHYIDRPLWREAVNYGIAAQQAAPDRPEPYRFLGQVYTAIQWYSRAWDAWQTYQALGGVLNAQTNSYIAEVSSWLGNSAFRAGRYQDAIRYYLALYAIEPTSEEANQHLALSYIATEQPEAALVHLQILTETAADISYATLLDRVDEQVTYGVAASNAFRQGLEYYSNNQKTEALLAFRDAVAASTDFRKAIVWAGRVAQELGRPQDAVTFWQRAVALDPSDSDAQAALELTRAQSTWGVAAYNAFQQGLALYAQGNRSAANQAFRQAVAANDRFAEAWAYLGATAFELRNYQEAVTAYDRARRLAPTNSSYAGAHAEAERALSAQLAAEQAQAAATSQPQTATPPTEAPQPAPDTADSPADSAAASATEDSEAEPVSDTPRDTTTLAATTPPPVLLEASVAPARQTNAPLTLLNLSYRHESPDRNGAGAFVFFEAPSALVRDLTGPDSYAAGTVYQRLEVISKPSDAPVSYQLCLVPNDDIGVRPACSTSGTLQFTTPGVYESAQPVSTFSQSNAIDWRRGISDLFVVIRDAQGNPVDPRYFFDSAGPLELDRYYPMQVRYQAMIIPAGSSFPGW